MQAAGARHYLSLRSETVRIRRAPGLHQEAHQALKHKNQPTNASETAFFRLTLCLFVQPSILHPRFSAD
jgi:hypothetical protein